MKILWITNIMLPPICKELNLSVPVIGGWMYSSLKKMQDIYGLEFAVATVYQGNEFVEKTINGTVYYLLPLMGKSNQKYQPQLEIYWQKIQLNFLPDVVHIHGTEYPHGLAYIRVCGAKNVVVSIQGMVSVYFRYYLGGISRDDILKTMTFRDILKQDNLLQQQRKFYKRGKFEQEYIYSVKHVIGRTSWDKAHVLAINPKVHYHFCNETLREEFYKHTWEYENCEKYSIFVSQAGYPIKGLHQILKALPYILKDFPGTRLLVGGADIRRQGPFVERLKRSGYGKYICDLIHDLSLEDYVVFTGMLNEQEMCERYLKSNVFVCPSVIENSPNSLGEAQLLGVPCVASYVGGVPDLMEGYSRGCLYRFEEIEMLAALVKEFFKQENWQENNYFNSIIRNRYDGQNNAIRLSEIYNNVSE